MKPEHGDAVGEPTTSVLVVAYGQPDQLRRCLDPLAGAYPVVVVDNSSDARCAAAARAAGATYVDPERNLGFAAAVNVGLDLVLQIGGDVLLLNPDAVIEPEAVARLETRLRAPGNERVAAVAPRQLGEDGEQRVSWPFPSPAGNWADALGLGRLVPRWSFLVGSVLLLRHTAVVDVGRFDERFFLYAEEADWQWRAHLRGWSVMVCDEVVAWHEGAGTSTDQRRRELLFHHSAELLLRKWYGGLGWQTARAGTIAGALARSVAPRQGDRRSHLERAGLYLRGPSRVASRLTMA